MQVEYITDTEYVVREVQADGEPIKHIFSTRSAAQQFVDSHAEINQSYRRQSQYCPPPRETTMLGIMLINIITAIFVAIICAILWR